MQKELKKLKYRDYADKELLSTHFSDLPAHKADLFVCYVAISTVFNDAMDRVNQDLDITGKAMRFYREAIEEARKKGVPAP